MESSKKHADLNCTCNEVANFCYKHSIKHQKIAEEINSNELLQKNNFGCKIEEPLIQNTDNLNKTIFQPWYNTRNISKKVEKLFNLFLVGPKWKTKRLLITNDSKYIISLSVDNKIWIWNQLKKKLEIVLLACRDILNEFLIVTNSKYIIFTHNKEIKIFNLLEMKEETTLIGHIKRIIKIAITIDNKYIIS